jgi:hypothetical protein
MKDIKEMDVAELEWLHKQIEGSSMADKEVLKGIRAELFDRNVDSFHGQPLERIMAHNPAFKKEYEEHQSRKQQNTSDTSTDKIKVDQQKGDKKNDKAE